MTRGPAPSAMTSIRTSSWLTIARVRSACAALELAQAKQMKPMIRIVWRSMRAKSNLSCRCSFRRIIRLRRKPATNNKDVAAQIVNLIGERQRNTNMTDGLLNAVELGLLLVEVTGARI